MKIPRLTLLLLLACVITANAQNSGMPATVPPNFAGDDPATLLRQLVDLRNRLLKDEFETTVAYEARILEEKKKPLIGSRTIDDTFYLVAHTVKAKYDADTQLMRFSLPVGTNDLAAVARSSSVDLKLVTDLGRYATYQVSLGGDTDPHVYFDSATGLSGPGSNQKFTATAKLEVEEAKRLKTGTKAVLAVQFEAPYATREYNDGGQFLTRLVAVQFFDQQTGRILGQAGAPEIKQDAQGPAGPNPPTDYANFNKNPSFKKPRILAKPEATYTDEASDHGIRGTVLLRVLFGETGQVTQISVMQGLPYGLTERAIAAARRIRFEPAELDGKKVAYPLVVVYRF